MSDEVLTAKTRRSLWPLIVIGLLAGQAIGVGALIRYATCDSGFAIEPNYYDRALRWDEEHAARALAESSGWTFEVTAAREKAVRGTFFQVHVSDKAGEPVGEAVVTLEVFASTRPRERFAIRAIEKDPGCYAATAPSDTPGAWEARVVCQSRNRQYIHNAHVNRAEGTGQ